MDLVHDRGSMDPVHESGPWTRSKEGVHGPLVHVLSSPTKDRCSDFNQQRPLLTEGGLPVILLGPPLGPVFRMFRFEIPPFHHSIQ